MKKDPVLQLLYRVKRGLAGYVSYLAACEMNESFSEYILYEPTLRILTAQGCSVQCEYPCPGYLRQGPGDVKKLDFVATCNNHHFAIEMKWVRTRKPDIKSDVEKLSMYLRENNKARGFLCIFGKKSDIQDICITSQSLRDRGKSVYAEFGVTR